MTGHILHRTVPADRWDLIAYKYYGDANRTSPLIAANRDLFAPTLAPIPLILPPGIEIKVPILNPEPISTGLLPPWKRAT